MQGAINCIAADIDTFATNIQYVNSSMIIPSSCYLGKVLRIFRLRKHGYKMTNIAFLCPKKKTLICILKFVIQRTIIYEAQ